MFYSSSVKGNILKNTSMLLKPSAVKDQILKSIISE